MARLQLWSYFTNEHTRAFCVLSALRALIPIITDTNREFRTITVE